MNKRNSPIVEKKEKDLWARLSEKATQAKRAQGAETYALFMGSKEAGKTTLIHYFLNPNKTETPKPTVTLEYLYARKTSANSASKAVAHLWELSEVKQMQKFMRVPFDGGRVKKSAFVVCVDLSRPGEVLTYMRVFLSLVRDIVTSLSPKEKDKENNSPLSHSTTDAYGQQPDLKDLHRIPVPVLVLGTKYDVFATEDSAKRKILAQAMRFIAHAYGVNLLFTTVKDKAMGTVYRQMISRILFRAEGTIANELDCSKALCITSGSDSLEEIGTPKGVTSDVYGTSSLQKKIDYWQKFVGELFPPMVDATTLLKNIAETEEEDDDLLPEAAVDAIRMQKKVEIRKLRESKTLEKSGTSSSGNKL